MDWQRSNNLVKGRSKQMFSYILGECAECYNLYGEKFGNIYQNCKYKSSFLGIYLIVYLPIPPLHLESRSPVDVLFLWFTDAEEFYPRVLTCCWFRWSGWNLGLLNWWCLDESLNFRFETLGNIRVGWMYFAQGTDINLGVQKADCSGLKVTIKMCPYLNPQNLWMLPYLAKGSYRSN